MATRSRMALCVAALVAVGACSLREIKAPAAPPSAAEVAELWVMPEPDRDLFYGAGGARLVPDSRTRFQVIEVKRGGFSAGYTVDDGRDRRWSAKFPPEASAEVAAARLLWGAGYHQPPVHFLRVWEADGADLPNPQMPARFRELTPDFHGLEYKGGWSFYNNPFVGTRELNGLLVMQAMFGNSDVKDSNNGLFEFKEAVEGAPRWYVVVDVGDSFGKTLGSRYPGGEIAEWERRRFISKVEDGRVTLSQTGIHTRLFKDIPVEHVRWACERLAVLTERQWSDAFRAAGYEPATAERYIRRLKEKVTEGLKLGGAAP